MIAANISTDEQLGQFVIEAELNDDVNTVPEQSLYLLDRAMIGRIQRENEGGVFADGYYVVAGVYELPEVYNGIRLPEEDLEQGYVFRLRVTPSEWEETAKAERPAAWISLPIQRETADGIALELGAGNIEDCVCLEFESVIPQITAGHFDGMYEFDQWNDIAEILSDCSSAEQIKVKAVLSAEKPWEADGIREVLEHLGQYEFEHDADGANDFFGCYLEHHLESTFDRSWLSSLSMRTAEGSRLLERLGASATEYGVISARGRSLYERAAYDEEGMFAGTAEEKGMEETGQKGPVLRL